jgi:Tc toxin complex TcA C-terminal TcB-binding domain
LTLLRSSVRVTPLLKDGVYARQPEDDRFVDYLGTVQQIVTSGGTNDAGLFEPNLRDDRPLPFEGAGADSTWRLELPKAFPAFDRSTISDVVLHLRFTARQGGDVLAGQAVQELGERLKDANTAGLALLFSLRHDFPTEWAAFANGNQDFAVTLEKRYFPYLAQAGKIVVDAVDLAARTGTRLGKRTVLTTAANQPALTALSDAINSLEGNGLLTIPPDSTILRRAAAGQIYLLIRYHLE